MSSFGSLGILLESGQSVLLGSTSEEHNVFVKYALKYVGTGTEELAWMEKNHWRQALGLIGYLG